MTNPLPAVSARTTGWALVGLLVVAAAWGSSFPLTKALLDRMSALNFLAVRFTLAALLMVVVFYPAMRRLSRRALIRGLWLGLAYGIAQILQTIGLQYTPASISGFITGMYVVLTPLCAAVLLRSAIGARVWVGAGIATLGLAILGLNGLSIGFGEAITLSSALIYALHIVGLSAWSQAREALGLASVQMVVTAAVSVLAALVFEGGITLPTTGFDWLAIIYMAVVSGAVAMIVQSWAQAHLAPSRAAITMATEPAWAALFSITFLGEALTWRMAVGGSLMLAAMVIVESGPSPKDDAESGPAPKDDAESGPVPKDGAGSPDAAGERID